MTCPFMKTALLTLAFIALAPITRAATEPKGFLVFELERFTYAEGVKGGKEVKQSYKVPLTEEFFAQFKRMPSQTSQGTGFYCSGGNSFKPDKPGDDGTYINWIIRRTTDNRWGVNMWGKGVETVKGHRLDSSNPSVSQYVKIRDWEDLDMSYSFSYVNLYDGINVSLRARYVSATEVEFLKSIPLARVGKATRSQPRPVLFKGDDQSELPLKMSCIFQED